MCHHGDTCKAEIKRKINKNEKKIGSNAKRWNRDEKPLKARTGEKTFNSHVLFKRIFPRFSPTEFQPYPEISSQPPDCQHLASGTHTCPKSLTNMIWRIHSQHSSPFSSCKSFIYRILYNFHSSTKYLWRWQQCDCQRQY